MAEEENQNNSGSMSSIPLSQLLERMAADSQPDQGSQHGANETSGDLMVQALGRNRGEKSEIKKLAVSNFGDHFINSAHGVPLQGGASAPYEE